MDIWLFILGYLVHVVASCILTYKIIQERSIYGLSIDTQICLLAATLSRCVWSLDTRLVETWLAYIELSLSTCMAVLLPYLMWKYDYTHTREMIFPLKSYVLIPASLLVAVFVHPSRNWITVQILVAFSIYLEAVALLPQLYFLRKMFEVETLTSHYVGLLVISRIIRLFFWITLYQQKEHFLSLFLADLLHSVLAADYFVLWVRKLRHGGTLVYKGRSNQRDLKQAS